MLPSSKPILNKTLLALFPLIYIALGFFYLKEIQSYYIMGPDSEYAYLMNGTSLASGFVEIGHVDHPGTPVQCFVAAVVFIQHLFTGKHLVYQDVLLNPESYLYTISTVLILLLALVTFLTGNYVYKHTGKVGVAVLFQLTPIGRRILEQSIMPRPEALIIIAGTFFMAYLYISLIKPEKAKGLKNALLYGMFVGFFIACKYVSVPLILLALFFLNTYKERLIFLLTTAASFFLFILPAFSMRTYMWNWVMQLITHDGKYGTGNNRIVDVAAFKHNILDIFFNSEFAFPVICFLISTAFIVAMVSLLRKAGYSKPYTKAIAGLWLTITTSVIIVAKHYAFYYLLPAQICFPLGIAVSDNVLTENLSLYKKYREDIIPLAVVGFAIVLLPVAFLNCYLPSEHKTAMPKTHDFVSHRGNIPAIITTGEDQASAFNEPSLYFGCIYSGYNVRNLYFKFLREHYTNSYEYQFTTGRLFNWDVNAAPAQVLAKSSKVLVYFRGKLIQNSEPEKQALNSFCNLPSAVQLGHYEKIYSDTSTYEDVFLIHTDSALAARLLQNSQTITTNLEAMNSNKTLFTSSDSNTFFYSTDKVTNEEHHSGNNAVKMDKDHLYALDAFLKVGPGYFISASVWKKSGDGKGEIIFTGTNTSPFFVSGCAVTDSGKNGWQRIECNCLLPPDYKSDSLHLYMFYPGNKTAYFDDAEITIYPLKAMDTSAIRTGNTPVLKGIL